MDSFWKKLAWTLLGALAAILMYWQVSQDENLNQFKGVVREFVEVFIAADERHDKGIESITKDVERHEKDIRELRNRARKLEQRKEPRWAPPVDHSAPSERW